MPTPRVKVQDPLPRVLNDVSRTAERAIRAGAEDAYSNDEHDARVLLADSLRDGESVIVPVAAIEAVLDAGFCTNECPRNCRHEIAQKDLEKAMKGQS